ncbi:hypothetical protein BKI52_02830 [marine bacterium AO1-C]|nr:hypothetical protein BKI52_02830 [marine bacterium AO1-C]
MKNNQEVIFETTKDQAQFYSKAYLSFLMFMLLGSFVAKAQNTYTWTGNVNSNWGTAGNWQVNGSTATNTPGTADEVVINNGQTVTLGASVTITNFTLNTGGINLNGFNLNINEYANFANTTVNTTGGKILIANNNNNGVNFNNSVINAEVEATAYILNVTGTNFYETTKLVGRVLSNGNTYHKTVSFIINYQTTAEISRNTADVFKDNIIIGGTNVSSLILGGDSFTTYLPAGKTITFDPLNNSLYSLSLRNFHQQGTTSQLLNGIARYYLNSTTWDAPLEIDGSTISVTSSTFNGATKFFGNIFSNGNTYHQNITLFTKPGLGSVVSQTTVDDFRENIIVGGSHNLAIGSDNFTTTLLDTKTITFDPTNAQYRLTLKNFHQVGNTSQTLNGNSRLTLIGTEWDAPLSVSVTEFSSTSSVFHQSTILTCTATSYNNGNTYHQDVEFIKNGHSPWYIGYNNPEIYNGNITARVNGYSNLFMAYSPGINRFQNNITLDRRGASFGKIVFGANGGQSILEDNNVQNIQAAPGKLGDAEFHHLKLDKASNDVNLLTNITIVGQMEFVKGLMKAAPNSTGLVIFSNNATYTGASATSYVSGWVQKQGNADFIFPIGIDTQYRPLSMASLSASAPVTAYFVNAPEPTGVGAPKCAELSSCEHWVVNSDNTAVTFTLGVNIDNTCVDPFPSNPSLFWFDKTQWNALNATVSGNMLTATETATTVPNNVTSGNHYVTIGSKVSLPGGNTMTGSTSVCQGQTYIYSVPAQTNTAYSWKLPIGWSIASTNQNSNQVTVTVGSNAQVGPQTVSVIPSTVTSSCEFCTLDPITLDVTVNTLPNVGSIVGLTTAKAGQSNITYSVTNTTGTNEFVWTLPTGVVENGSGSTGTITTTVPYITVDFVTGFAGGNINVYGTSTTCGNGPTVSMFVSLCTTCRASNATLPDNLKNNHLTVFPNPIMGSEKIKIQIEGQTEISVVNVVIVDEKGAKVKSFVQELQNGIVEIPGQSLAPGKYLLRIQVGSEIVGKKILKY